MNHKQINKYLYSYRGIGADIDIYSLFFFKEKIWDVKALVKYLDSIWEA